MLAVALVFPARDGFAGPLPPAALGGAHVGAGSCASAHCHGGVAAAKGATVLQDEYTLWQQQDAHANAFRLLQSPRARGIAENLGLGSPTASAECLGCHSDAVPPAQQGKRWRAEDGVSCETCHGGADRWLDTHSKATREAAAARDKGMYALDPPVARARVCLHCHQGSADRPITHRLMSAGHPRLSFELDTFTAIEPAHFVVDEDYRRRKTVASGATTWVAGQLVAAEFALDGLAGPRFSPAQLVPELMFYDCNSCHRPLGGASRVTRATGQPQLGDVPLVLTGQILAVLAPESAAPWNEGLAQLEGAAQASPEKVREAAGRLKVLAQDAQARLGGKPVSPSLALKLLDSVGAAGASQAEDLTLAEQVAMAAGALANHLVTERGGKGAAAVKPPLDAVFASVADPAKYDPARFQAAIGKFRSVATREFGDK